MTFEFVGSIAIVVTRPEYACVVPGVPIGAGPSGVHVVLDDRFGVDTARASRCANAPGQLTPKQLVQDAVGFLKEKQTADIKETVAQAVERMRIGSANAERMSGELDDALGRIAQPAR